MQPEQYQNTPPQDEPKKDRSLLYFALVLGAIVAVMGYLTLFVDDPSSLFKKEEKVELKDKSADQLNEAANMDEEEVRRSLIQFIESFYRDQRKGYFDPPSYFAPITQTFYNFHNLTHDRVKELYWQRMTDMKNLSQNWIVSTLDFTRQDNQVIATYILKQSYFRPSRSLQESADVKYEMTIDENGKIVSLKELEVKNYTSYKVETDLDSAATETDWEPPAGSSEEPQPTPPPAEKPVATEKPTPAASADKVYDIGSVQTPPEFPGGQKELNKLISSRLRYPQAAKDAKVQGRVFVSFIVEKTGSLSDFKILRGIGSGCDEEAIRVIRSTAPWKPGVADSRLVRTTYTVPVNFQLKD